MNTSLPHVSRLLGILLLSVAGGCSLSAEADVPDVAITQHDISFAGVPMAGRLGDVSTALSFMQTRPAIDLPKGTDSSVKAVKVELVAKSGVTDLSFLRMLRVVMAPVGGTAAPVELVNYEKAAGSVVGATLSIASQNPANILEQWQAAEAEFTVDVAGTLPEVDWSIDLSAHFSGAFSYRF